MIVRWSTHCGPAGKNLTSIHEDVGSIPGPLSGLMNTAMSCGVGHRGGLDVVLLWLWCPAVVAPTRPPAWELPYAAGVVLKKKKKVTETRRKKSCPKPRPVSVPDELHGSQARTET